MAALLGGACKLAFCGGVFCGSLKGNGEEHGLRIPKSLDELRKFGVPWFQAALREAGQINVTVESAQVAPLGGSGLLSDIAMCTLMVNDKGEERKLEFLIKYAPPKFKTRMTTDLFKLSYAEYKFYQVLMPELPRDRLRVPQLVCSDFNRTSGLYYLGLEKLTATFKDVRFEEGDKAISIVDAEAMFKFMAEWHAFFWGDVQSRRNDLGFIMRGDGPLVRLGGNEAKRHWPTYKKFVDREMPGALTEELQELSGLVQELNVPISKEGMDWGWTAICHGDPRLDNFFFEEQEGCTEPRVGMLDFQIVNVGPVPSDLAWIFCTSIPPRMLEEHGDRLIQLYYDTLTDRLAASGCGCVPGGVDELRELVGLSAAFKFAIATVVVVGGIDSSAGDLVLETQRVITSRTLNFVNWCGSFDTMKKYKEGSTLVQSRMRKTESLPHMLGKVDLPAK